jgi:L-threonylcarbamoyladenylate synthase
LRRGGIVALPTETVYGLAADADNDDAVRQLFAAKERPADHPVIVHISGADAIDNWALEVPDAAHVLARSFWPGPLTLVLRRSPRAHNIVTGGQDTVGLRSPAHPWARALLRAFGGAVAAPSANSFGRISPTTAQHVTDDLGIKPRGKVDLILDGGPCPGGIESTIVDVSSDAPTLLRPGAITRDQLQEALGHQVDDAGSQSPRAPGRLEKHYAPYTPLVVMPFDELATTLSKPGGERIAVLAPLSLLQHCRADVALAIAAAERPDDYARLLYSALHRLDSSGADRMLVATPPDGPQWEAVRDRLRRAEAAKTG